MNYRIGIFIIMLIMGGTIHAQDTLVLRNGQKELIQLISENADGVRFKKWSNMNGPTWVKKKDEIKEIKRVKIILQSEGEDLSFSYNNQDCMSGGIIVYSIDALYKSNEVPTTIQSHMMSYVKELPQCVNLEKIHNYYLNLFEQSKTIGNTDVILQYGQTYLFLGGEDKMLDIVEVLVLMYADRNNEEMVSWWLDFLEHYSEENENIFDEDIARLRQEVDDLQHNFERDLCGNWVLLNRVTDKWTYGVSCPMILRVEDLSKANGAHLIQPQYAMRKDEGLFPDPINTSQGIFFNGQANYSIFQFSSEIINDRRGWTDFSHIVMENTRKTAVEMNATIFSSDADFDEKVNYGIIVALTSATINAMVSNMNTSSKYTEVYNVYVYPNKPKVMNTIVTHVSTETLSPNSAYASPKVIYNEYVKNKKSYMVKWEEDDSLFFVAANGGLLSFSKTDDPTNAEYWDVLKNHSFRNPSYLLPSLCGTALSLWAIIEGFNKLVTNSGDVTTLESFIFYGGAMALCFSWEIPKKIMEKKRRDAFDEINRRNIAKLRQKASASLSLSPSYYSENNAFGAAVNISF